ncbi:hypothetical protein IAU60_004362 [Kwoniella sp. DSM 27419]
MPLKKRRTSPSAASSASATPAPAALAEAASDSLTFGEGLAGPGPSTLEQKAVQSSVEQREYARMGNMQLGTDFRYAPCSLSPNPSPHPLYSFHRTIPYPSPVPPVHMSLLDRSAFLRISPTALTVSNDRGFRSARANVAVREGTWYFEVKIERGSGSIGGSRGHLAGENAHVRVGWGRREAHIDAPVGADGYSYAIRDVGGEKVTLSRAKPYGREFVAGDVVGCLITLPPRDDPSSLPKADPAHIKRHRRHFNYKGQSYFESPEYLPSKEMDALVDREGKGTSAPTTADTNGETNNGGPGKKGATTKNTKKGKKEPAAPVAPVARTPAKLPGSSITFFLNGESLGVAFTDLYDFVPLPPLYQAVDRSRKHVLDDGILHDDGSMGYYPMISCFGKGKAKFNPGPRFDRPPEGLFGGATGTTAPRPMCERWAEFREEERGYDEQGEEEEAQRLRKLLEDEEKQRKAWARDTTLTKKRKAVSGKKKKVDVDVDASSERAGTMTPGRDYGMDGLERGASPEEKPTVQGEEHVQDRVSTQPSSPAQEDSPGVFGQLVVGSTPASPNASGRLEYGGEVDMQQAGEDGQEGVQW